jgi:hypothetical protein
LIPKFHRGALHSYSRKLTISGEVRLCIVAMRIMTHSHCEFAASSRNLSKPESYLTLVLFPRSDSSCSKKNVEVVVRTTPDFLLQGFTPSVQQRLHISTTQNACCQFQILLQQRLDFPGVFCLFTAVHLEEVLQCLQLDAAKPQADEYLKD